MATPIMQEPFPPSTVFWIVFDESQKWHVGLKERVTAMVVEIVGVDKLPDKIGYWIQEYCLPITEGTPMKDFDEDMQEPIDLATIPNRRK